MNYNFWENKFKLSPSETGSHTEEEVGMSKLQNKILMCFIARKMSSNYVKPHNSDESEHTLWNDNVPILK